MKSYSSESQGVAGLFREFASLHQLHSRDASHRVRSRIAAARQVEESIRERLAVELNDLDVLEIGPGQFPIQMTYFACRNRVVGIDRDVIVQGFQPLGYLKMLKANGARRTIKTIGRKLLGVDRKYADQLKGELGIARLPRLTVNAMDVCNMSFAAGSFDFVYSRSVLHSLPNPDVALDEIVRVLRPGGAAYISIHPYTSQTGCLDPRIYTDRRSEVMAWQHLRATEAGGLERANVYLNNLRIHEWRALFGGKMDGAEFILNLNSDPEVIASAKELKKQGQLRDYSMEELIAGELVAVWRKPGAPTRAARQVTLSMSAS